MPRRDQAREGLDIFLQKEIGDAKKTLAGFAKRVTSKRPVSAFEFSSSAVAAAAKLEVYAYILGARRRTTEEILSYARERVTHLASYGYPRSTSTLSPVLAAETLAAWAKVIRVIEGKW